MTELAGPQLAGRGPALLGLLVLLAVLVVVVALDTPWRVQAVPAGGRTAVDPGRDFTAAEAAREEAFHAAVRPPAYAALALGVLLAAAFGVTSAGARLAGALAGPLGGGWVWQVLLGGLVLALAGELVTAPLAARAELVLRHYGLSTRDWSGWLADLAKAFGLGTGITLAALLAGYAVIRAAPATWWAWTGLGGAALLVVLSFGYPLLVEPVFNRFASMQDGPLRTSLLRLAADDGVPVRDVLVADASRRTTALNAYVSGLGATRRIVVYDTLLRTGSDRQVRLVVAHELGHAKRHDVLRQTLLGALGVSAASCAAYLVLSWPPLLHRAGVAAAGDGRSVALLLFLGLAAGMVCQPAPLLLSRRVEATADVHSLDLTRDPAGFVEMERTLAVTNIADLDPHPVRYALFASHPTAPRRIALARDWARLHGVPEPAAGASR